MSALFGSFPSNTVVASTSLMVPVEHLTRIQGINQMLNGGRDTIWQGVKSGLRYVSSWPGLLIVSLMTAGINFTIIPAFSLMPLLVKEYFGGSAIHPGWVEPTMGIGMFVGGALLGAWGGFKRNIVTAMLGLMGMGLGTLVGRSHS